MKEESTAVSRVGVDIGGTFTDTAACGPDGILRIGKSLTTPGHEGAGVLASIASADVDLSEVMLFVHGTTLVINALIERRGVATAIVATCGFGDVVALGRGSRPEIYNPFYKRHPPFVPENLRFEIAERMSAAGIPIVTPRDEDVATLVRQMREVGVKAVAVAFLHSYRNPDHERRVADQIARAMPDVFVTASSDLGRQWREFERFTTATANAYVGPLIKSYISRLIDDLEDRGFRGDALFLDAGGGAIGRSVVEAFPIRLVESGPVGGVIAAARIARQLGLENVVTLDIGGTTAKASLIENGAFETLNEYWIGGYDRGLPIQVPVVDIEEVGAGGGSIAWLDDGRLRLGPRSAGAVPGPAAYGRGGSEPTITDALVHCGLFHPSIFLAELEVDVGLATAAIKRTAVACGLSPDRLALGMLQISAETTAGVVRRQTLERGLDPERFTMIVSGGAGPGQACAVAETVGIARVLIPPSPGHFSAIGMLQSDLRFSRQVLIETPLSNFTVEDLRVRVAQLRRELEAIVAQDVQRAGHAHVEVGATLRYQGQEHSLRMPIMGEMTASQGAFEKLVPAAFRRTYLRRYGYADDLSPLEIIDVEVVLQRDLPAVDPVGGAEEGDWPATTVSCLFSEDVGFQDVRAVHRATLAAGEKTPGPLLVFEPGSISVVPPQWVVERSASRHLIITREKRL